MQARSLGMVLTLSLAALCCSAVGATTVILVADADATLYEPDSGAGETANSRGESFFSGRISGGPRRRALLHFPLSSIPSGATVTSAMLTVSETRTIGGSVATSLYRVSAPWSEGNSFAAEPAGQGAVPTAGDPTWTQRVFPATPWVSAGGDSSALASATIAIGAETDYTFASTALLVADVQAWVDQPANNFGWQLRTDENAAAPTAKRFASRENGNPDLRPRLQIEFGTAAVAVPGLGRTAIALLLLAMAALASAAGFGWHAGTRRR